MNFGNSFTFEEGVTHLIAIGIYGILFFITLIWALDYEGRLN